MKLAVSVAALTGVALATLRAQTPARDRAVPSPADGAVRGRVLAADTHEPIRKARVELIAATGDRRDPVYSDNDGRYAFTAVPAGRYSVSAWKSGYALTTFGARTLWEPAAPIALGQAQSIDGLDVLLVKGAAISGRVVDDLGEPLPDMQVSVGRVVPGDGRLVFQMVGLATNTDDRGEYRIGGLPPGTFVVSAFGWSGPSANAPPEARQFRPHSTFHPQTPFLAQARPLVLRAGEDVGAVDIAFTADSTATPTISGRVIDPRGAAVQAGLSATSSGSGVAAAMRGLVTTVQPSGEFSMHVEPGDYTLIAQTSDLIAITQVTVDRSDVTGVVLALAPGARISGRVVFDGTTPRPPESFAVEAIARDQRIGIDPPRMGSQSARVRPDASFTMSNVIGTCELRVSPQGRGWRPKSITVGGRSLLDVPIDFKSGDELRDVVVVLTDRTSELDGVVVAAPEARANGVSVLVFADDRRQAPRRSRWVRPDQNGRFVVSDLAPGEYLIALATDVDDRLWQTAAYLDRFRQDAKRVTLGDGETKSVTVEWVDPR